MLAIAKAYKERSLQDFQAALSAHEAQLMGDPIVRAHLSALYDTLLEGNLARLIEPFSRVEITHLADLIKLPRDLVLNKLSQVRGRLPTPHFEFSLPGGCRARHEHAGVVRGVEHPTWGFGATVSMIVCTPWTVWGLLPLRLYKLVDTWHFIGDIKGC